MKIYAIESGEYSDYCVHGYCTSEEQAMQTCAFLNQEIFNGRASVYIENYVYTYQELECLDRKQPVPILYFFRSSFSYNSSAGSWAGRIDHGPYMTHSPCEQVSKRGPTYFVDITVRNNDRSLAAKAAQDVFYKYLAAQAEGYLESAQRCVWADSL